MGFSAMLADQYILIVPSLIIFSPGWTNKAQRENTTSTALTLLSIIPKLRDGLTNHGISLHRQALTLAVMF